MKHTPRTNERVIINDEGAWVSAAFARSLEIELEEAKERISRIANTGLFENALIKKDLDKLNTTKSIDL
jgi:hypothetical protein